MNLASIMCTCDTSERTNLLQYNEEYVKLIQSCHFVTLLVLLATKLRFDVITPILIIYI